jgi:biotin-dependent carboxylase-like uncharacterized protein
MTRLTVLAPGTAATLQDLGRPGHAHLGVGRSGAADRASHARANRLVGNAAAAATVEVLLGGFSAVVDRPVWCAVTGATVGVYVEQRPVSRALFLLPAGATLSLTPAVTGLRAYLAVAGGLEGTAVFDSFSWDSLARHGTPPAEAGTVWQVGDAHARPPFVDVDLGLAAPAAVDIAFTWGPRDDEIGPEGRAQLLGGSWSVDAASDRVGVRLAGARIGRSPGELPSEGSVRGSIQIPPSGQPIVFLADHPVTGGYPVAGVVDPAACDALAQARPGTPVRLRARSA